MWTLVHTNELFMWTKVHITGHGLDLMQFRAANH